MKRLLLLLIRVYQTQISPGLPPRCRFVPTCSEYAREAVEKYGAAGALCWRQSAWPSASLSPAEVYRV